MTFQDFLQEWHRIRQDPIYENSRVGQIAYDALDNLDNDLAERLIHEGPDPYYNDHRIPAFLLWLQEQLG